MAKTTIDLVRDFTALLSFDEPVNAIIDNSDETYDIEVCETHHQTVGCIVTLDSKEYFVTEVVRNEKIVIKEVNSGAGEPAITTFPIPAPKFFHGTAIDVNAELVKITDSEDKLPMIYFFEIFSQDVNRIPDAALDRTANITLYMMAQSKFQEWTIDEYYSNAIEAMLNLTIDFTSVIEVSGDIGVLTGYNTTNLANFGIATTQTGTQQATFDTEMSGVAYTINLPILKCNKCNGKCKC